MMGKMKKNDYKQRTNPTKSEQALKKDNDCPYYCHHRPVCQHC